jgi:hypothetical protein
MSIRISKISLIVFAVLLVLSAFFLSVAGDCSASAENAGLKIERTH